jgi:hypothetical protein
MISFNYIVLPDSVWRSVWAAQTPEAAIDCFPSVAHAYAFALLEAPKWEKKDPLINALWLSVKAKTYTMLCEEANK